MATRKISRSSHFYKQIKKIEIMTAIKITQTFPLSNENRYIGRFFSCNQCTRSQIWHSKRRFKR